MSFQKCPKCNGHGQVTNSVFDINRPETMAGQPLHIPCPLCLGEFVIHEEQGVPPSKVKVIFTYEPFIKPKPHFRAQETKYEVSVWCGCDPIACKEFTNCKKYPKSSAFKKEGEEPV